MAGPASSRQRFLQLLINHFCRPTDTIETKRQQCILVGTLIFLHVVNLFAFIHTILLGVFAKSVMIPIAVGVFSILLFDCWRSKTTRTARAFFVFAIYYSFHMCYQRNGLINVPHLLLLGLLPAILAIFLSPYQWEPTGWILIFFGEDAVVLILHLRKAIPPTLMTDPQMVIMSTFITILFVAFIFFQLVWFYVHVYNSEVEKRQTLEKELHIFMRLSHEIRTPITIISGLAELMKEWPSLSMTQKGNISDLATAARRLTSVVNDLLAFSEGNDTHGPEGEDELRRKSGHQMIPTHSPRSFASVPHDSVVDLTPAPDPEGGIDFNIRDVVDQAIGYHLTMAENRSLNVYVDIPDSIPLEVNGVKSRLLCVLDHLVGNAIKFTPSGSVSIQVSSQGNSNAFIEMREYRFEIRDTGIGMNADELRLSFQPFVQGNVSATRGFDGMGLGLTIVERLVKKWGRTIEAKSLGPGHGSTFSFSAPFRALSSSFRIIPFPAAGYSLPSNVLLIDEDEQSAKGIKQMLSYIGCSLVDHTAWTGFSVESCRSFECILICPVVDPNDSDENVQRALETMVSRIRASIALGDLVSPPDSNPPSPPCGGPSRVPTSLIFVGSSRLQTWCRDSLRCAYLQKPPSLCQLRSTLRSVADSVASFSNSQNATCCSTPLARDRVGLGSNRSNIVFPKADVSGPLADGPAIPVSQSSNRLSVPTASSTCRRASTRAPLPGNVTSPSMESVPNQTVKCGMSDDSTQQQPQPTRIYQMSRSSSPAPSTTTSPPVPNRILCVDDSPVVLRLLLAFIRKSGFNGIVDSAFSGEEALSLATQHTYRLVLMDFNMPGLSGADTTMRLRQQLNLSMEVLPVIGVTAAPSMREVCLQSGMNGVIFKPFSQETIAELVKVYVLSPL